MTVRALSCFLCLQLEVTNGMKLIFLGRRRLGRYSHREEATEPRRGGSVPPRLVRNRLFPQKGACSCMREGGATSMVVRAAAV